MNSTVLKAIMALFCMVLTTACKESSENEDYSPLQLVSVTPSEGEQVTAGTVEVVFEFNQSVEIKDAEKITLNNKAVENAYAVVKYLKAKVEVEAESTNIFKIASGALLAKPSDVENEEMNITFTARAEENYNNRHFDINPVPCNPNADEPAKALYVWLLKQFGKKMISGSTQNAFVWYKNNVGITPLIIGWDMQPYCPHYSYYWQDGHHTFGPLTDNPTTPDAIAWYKDNGKKPITAFQWHWHSPMGGQAGTNTFYTNETDFDASKAVIEGTAEYETTIRDIDAIAVQLKKLSDAGVPILWRPLHEAGGTWFWWSSKGPEVYKQLWNMVYERLTYHHQLNNLIWVWNGDDADWYVGDDKCDIISNDVGKDDIYLDNYDKAYRVTNGKKLLSLSESGTVPDVEKALEAGVCWSYWSTWGYDPTDNKSAEKLKVIFSSPKVITLENYE